jgi:hypothetical protein
MSNILEKAAEQVALGLLENKEAGWAEDHPCTASMIRSMRPGIGLEQGRTPKIHVVVNGQTVDDPASKGFKFERFKQFGKLAKAVSEKQQQFMGAELQRKREGKKTQTGMSEGDLKDFASTPHEGIPKAANIAGAVSATSLKDILKAILTPASESYDYGSHPLTDAVRKEVSSERKFLEENPLYKQRGTDDMDKEGAHEDYDREKLTPPQNKRTNRLVHRLEESERDEDVEGGSDEQDLDKTAAIRRALSGRPAYLSGYSQKQAFLGLFRKPKMRLRPQGGQGVARRTGVVQDLERQYMNPTAELPQGAFHPNGPVMQNRFGAGAGEHAVASGQQALQDWRDTGHNPNIGMQFERPYVNPDLLPGMVDPSLPTTASPTARTAQAPTRAPAPTKAPAPTRAPARAPAQRPVRGTTQSQAYNQRFQRNITPRGGKTLWKAPRFKPTATGERAQEYADARTRDAATGSPAERSMDSRKQLLAQLTQYYGGNKAKAGARLRKAEGGQLRSSENYSKLLTQLQGRMNKQQVAAK